MINRIAFTGFEEEDSMDRLKYIICVILIGCVNLAADTWAPPEPQKYYSADSGYCFEIIPGDSMHACRGILSMVPDEGEYQTVWSAQLVNDISPVTAFVSDEGNYVATFDNWYRIGWGDDVVVIYGMDGELIAKFGLEDILSANEIEKIPRTVASRWWGGKHSIDEAKNVLILKVVSNGEMPYSEKAQFLKKHIDLKTGRLIKECCPETESCPFMRWIRNLRDMVF
jgi:hypothetical protein